MKIRNGFVSNSSSSSFICVGLRIDGAKVQGKFKDEALDKLLEENDNSIYWDSEITGDFFYGDYELHEDGTIEMVNILKKNIDLSKLENLLKVRAEELLGIPKSAMKFGIWMGTVAT